MSVIFMSIFSFEDEDMEYTTTSPGIPNSSDSDSDDFDLNAIESLEGTCSK